MNRTICLELNEINFDMIKAYAAKGYLPRFKKLIDVHGVIETTSEQEYEHLEPWIQWVTAHTGKTFAEHGVFRLGDIVGKDMDQIWEVIEKKGFSVGAISPINADDRTSHALFFVPDPWTDAKFTGNRVLRGVYDAIRQAVNDNAQARISLKSLSWLIVGAAVYARPVNYLRYLSLALGAKSRPWSRALFLDLLLCDTFIGLMKKRPADFATLFLNAGAHIQHHYMFSSEAYSGENKNPEWYVPAGVDPVRDVYVMYDEILDQIFSTFAGSRFVILTGLHQDPHDMTEYYWRLRDHAAFLKKHKIPFTSVEPRMSRDFLVTCADAAAAADAARRLGGMRAIDGNDLFYVDNRGADMFVTLTYPNDIGDDFVYAAGNERFADFRADVAFVAIKNGKHNGIGYLIDTGESCASEQINQIRLTSVFDRLVTTTA
jgi:hypothetical protein